MSIRAAIDANHHKGLIVSDSFGDPLVVTGVDLTNANPMHVAIVDASGTQISSFGGGTQYTEGDVDASVTGTAVMWEDTSDTIRVASAAKPLPVNVVSGGSATGATSTITTVSASITSVTLKASSSGRLAISIYNDSNYDVYIKYGTTASTTDFTVLLPSLGLLVEEKYTGRMDGIWLTASGTARITEVTA